MVIQHNLQAQNANRMLKGVTSNQSKSVKNLSSGYKVNSAADDAAGLSISEKMRHQIRGLNKASNNAQDGVSLIQVTEGALNEVHSILQRMNELAVQAANDTNTSCDRGQIKKEIDQLAIEIDRIASVTQFNTMNLLDGSFRDKNFQIGALAGQGIQIEIMAMDTHGLGLTFDMYSSQIDNILATKPSIKYIERDQYGNYNETNTAYPKFQSAQMTDANKKNSYSQNPHRCLGVESYEMAGKSMKLIQNAVDLVSEMRASLGATQNRLEHTIANLDNISENTTTAESRIRDTDMAEEMVAYSKNNILVQAGQSVLAQANQNTQGVLSLLQ